MSWQTLRDGIDAYWASLVPGYTGTLRTAEKAGLVTAVARGVIDELGGGGGSQPIIIRPDTITPGTRHEIVDGWLGLKRDVGYDLTDRQIALASPEYGHVWTNRAQLTEAWENPAGTGECRYTIAAAGGFVTRTRAYHREYGMPMHWIARFRCDAPWLNDQGGGFSCYKDTPGGPTYEHVFIGRWGGNPVIRWWGSFTGTVILAAGALAAGVWVGAHFNADRLVIYYSTTVTADPLSVVWTFGQDGGGNDWRTICAGTHIFQPVAAAVFHVYTMHLEDWQGFSPLAPVNPIWGAQGYDTLSTAIQILDVNDAGASSNTEIKALFTGLAAKAGSTATLQVSGKRSAGAGSAFVTWSTPAAWSGVDGAGDWLRLGLRWVSDGTQPGSVFFGAGVALRSI